MIQLIGNKCDWNLQSRAQHTPILYACQYCDVDDVRFGIENCGADGFYASPQVLYGTEAFLRIVLVNKCKKTQDTVSRNEVFSFNLPSMSMPMPIIVDFGCGNEIATRTASTL